MEPRRCFQSPSGLRPVLLVIRLLLFLPLSPVRVLTLLVSPPYVLLPVPYPLNRDRDEVNRLERERAKLERERRERERLEHERETERLKIEKLRLEEQKRALKRSLEEEAASVASFKQSSSSAR